MDKKNQKPSIYIVDDEKIVLKAVSQSVASLECAVTSFASARECLEAQSAQPCDLVISDINMPEIDGISLLKALRAKWPETKVLIMTGYGDIPLAVEAVKNGAVDFIEKPLDERTFLPKIQELIDSIDHINSISISAAERKVLKLVVKGLSNKEIAFEIGRSIRTVENHRHRLMKRLKLTSQADLIKFALSKGFAELDKEKVR